eukprot:TRINITY_DN1664_c0_g1_i7.p1 TRINITY_DN1664_c0_g1~~TRINITY_DN1664_c0_g1_i7.p1  ORF type:complete len:520 (+),score=107.15 TRINITY_DN1664_c0_g1_i7:38-1597(+)
MLVLFIATLGLSLAEVNIALGKKATQICDYPDTPGMGLANRAIDGNSDGNYWGNSVTHTCVQYEAPWWQLDLGTNMLFNKIRIHNRRDYLPERLSNFDVILKDSLGKVVKQTHFEGYYTGWCSPACWKAEALLWSFPPVFAQYVTIIKRVQTPGVFEILSLAEVEVLQSSVNLALGKTASQPTQWAPNMGASAAVDGKTDGLYSGSTTHTLADTNNWWKVDLFTPSTVTQVIVHNADAAPSWTSGFYIELIDSLGNVLKKSPNFIGVQLVYSWTFQPLAGVQVVKITLPSQGYLHLAEVEVIGASVATNIALSAKATLSTTSPSMTASLAIDGNNAGDVSSGTIAATATGDLAPKLTIDLLKKTSISKVIIYARTICCTNYLNNANLSFYGDSLSSPPIKSTSFLVGDNELTYSQLIDDVRYIVLKVPNEALQVAEVEVYHSMAPSLSGSLAEVEEVHTTATAEKDGSLDTLSLAGLISGVVASVISLVALVAIIVVFRRKSAPATSDDYKNLEEPLTN